MTPWIPITPRVNPILPAMASSASEHDVRASEAAYRSCIVLREYGDRSVQGLLRFLRVIVILTTAVATIRRQFSGSEDLALIPHGRWLAPCEACLDGSWTSSGTLRLRRATTHEFRLTTRPGLTPCVSTSGSNSLEFHAPTFRKTPYRYHFLLIRPVS
jgi:hypothetical protein